MSHDRPPLPEQRPDNDTSRTPKPSTLPARPPDSSLLPRQLLRRHQIPDPLQINRGPIPHQTRQLLHIDSARIEMRMPISRTPINDHHIKSYNTPTQSTISSLTVDTSSNCTHPGPQDPTISIGPAAWGGGGGRWRACCRRDGWRCRRWWG